MTSGIEQWHIILVRHLFISAMGILGEGWKIALEDVKGGDVSKGGGHVPAGNQLLQHHGVTGIGLGHRRLRRSVCPRNPKCCGSRNNTPNTRRNNYWGPSCNRNECWLHPFRYLIVSSRKLCILSPDFSVVFYLQIKRTKCFPESRGTTVTTGSLWPRERAHSDNIRLEEEDFQME